MKNRTLKTIFVNLIYLVLSSIVVLFVHNHCFYRHVFDDVSAWGTFYTVFGVLYAIIAGFLIIEALSKYNNLNELIEEEINELQDIRDLAIYFNCDGELIKKIIFELKGYVQSVIKFEWLTMKQGTKSLNPDTTREMYEIFSAINEMDIRNKKDEISLTLFMQKMTNLTTLRTKRISISTQTLPVALKVLLYFMSLCLILGLMLLGVYNVFIHVLMVISLVVSVQLLNSIILDIDNPFEGIWQIKPVLFSEFVKTLEEKEYK